jgi:hypothetical protein
MTKEEKDKALGDALVLMGRAAAIGEAVRDLCKLDLYRDGVPSGLFYVRVENKLTLPEYSACVTVLQKANVVELTASGKLKWIGGVAPEVKV